MTALLALEDIRTYLLDVGWQRHQETWRGASIWSNAAGREVLVPAHDDFADADLRIKEILSTLTVTEGRTATEIATDINTPLDDIQKYRTTFDDNFLPLVAGLQTLQSVQNLISAAARIVMSGAQSAIPRGAPPEPVDRLLQEIRLGPDNPADHVITVRIPLDMPSQTAKPRASENGSAGATPLGRRVGHQLRAAVFAAWAAAQATSQGDLAAFEDSVAAGVSANLCEALAELSGGGRDQPFEITFRWGRGLPTDVPAGSVRFTGGTTAIMRAGARHLRRLGSAPEPSRAPTADPGTATMTGLVESLRGKTRSDDWLITVRGDLAADSGTRDARMAWVLLDSPAAYERAIEAHRLQARVQARGLLSGTDRRTQLNVNDDNFEILERDA